MWRLAAIALTALWVAGCGGDGAGTAANSAPTPAGPCPEGTEPVRARDVIGPTPEGYEVVPGDNEVLASIAATLKEGLGERWRSHDAKILVRRGRVNGTAVLVVNSTERRGDTMEGFLAAERDAGKQGEAIEVAGQPGRLRTTADGAYVALAPAGECSIVLLLADREPTLRDAVSVIGTR